MLHNIIFCHALQISDRTKKFIAAAFTKVSHVRRYITLAVTLSRRLPGNMVICVKQSPSFVGECLTHRLNRSRCMHVPYRLAEKIASAGAARRLAWVAWGISASLILSATIIRSLERVNLLQSVDSICAGVAFGLFATVGALIAWQRPRNTIGWIFCAVGIGTGITDFSGAYTTYGVVKGHLPLPGADVFNGLGNIVWPVNWVLFLVFLPLLFPNGRLLTQRWRIVGWLAAILALLSILTAALSVVSVELFGKVIPADFWDSLASNINLLEL